MNASSEQALLARLEGDDTLDLADILRLIVDWLRPTRAERGVAAVVANIETLVMALDEHPALRQRLAKRLEAELGSARHLALYTEIGLSRAAVSCGSFASDFTNASIRGP